MTDKIDEGLGFVPTVVNGGQCRCVIVPMLESPILISQEERDHIDRVRLAYSQKLSRKTGLLMPKCLTCNYCREPGKISPEPKQDSIWCSNSYSPFFMHYINNDMSCKAHQKPTPKQKAAAVRFLETMSNVSE